MIVKLYLEFKRPLHTLPYVTDLLEWRYGLLLRGKERKW